MYYLFNLIYSADFQKYWCSVEKSILFYESDRCHEPSMKIDVKDIICLGVSRPDSSNNSGFIDKWVPLHNTTSFMT